MTSLVITVLNEKNNLPIWLLNIKSQTLLPDEIVIVDGGSTDGTWEWLQSQTDPILKIFQKKGNISVGRNFAISQAKSEIVVVTDAGCVYDKTWFFRISEPLLSGQADFVSTAFGPWLKDGDSFVKYLIAASTTPAKREFEKDWLPSSRSVAFRKELWQNIGGYPEWIPICEDIIFDLKLKKSGVNFCYIREPLVFWQPRPNLAAYFKQLFRYTKSDGHGKLWLNRHLIRYFTYFGGAFLVYLSFKINQQLLLLLVVLALLYMKKFWLRWYEYTRAKNIFFFIAGFIFLPVVIFVGDIAKICGWPVGVIERYTGKIKFQNY